MLSSTHAGTASHASEVAFQAKAGSLQAQLVWPTSALLVLYSDVVPHARQLTSPASENWPAPHAAPQTELFVAEQVESMTAPAHEAHEAQGEMPEALQVEPPSHGESVHVLLVAFHE